VRVTVPERPRAIDDAAGTDPGVPVRVDVLANDIAAVGLTPRIAAQGDRGTAVVGPDNQVTYTPAAGLAGPDTFRYELLPPGGTVPLTAADVTITVAAPGAVDDSARMFSDQFALIRVTDNDRFATHFTVRTGTAGHGQTAVENGTVVRYTPAPGFHGQDRFDYDLIDARGSIAATARVRARVRLVDAVNDTVTIAQAEPVTIRVLANDTTAPGVSVALRKVPPAAGHIGTVTLNANGRVVFTPGSQFHSGDGFRYALTGVVRGQRIDLDQANVVIKLKPATPGGSTPGGSTPPGGTTPGGPGGSTPGSPTPTLSPTPIPSTTPTTPPAAPVPIGVKINVSSASPQSPVQVTGSRCPANTPVQIDLDGVSAASVNADPGGQFAATISAPRPPSAGTRSRSPAAPPPGRPGSTW
jgi:hypothetical protein